MFPFSHRMTDAQAKHAGAGRHAAGNGLWLCRTDNDVPTWVIFVTVQGEQREVQLGTYPDLSVRAARQQAVKLRKLARRGLDPAAQQEAFRDAAARNLHQFYC